jgi:membrane glycosyltransferase
MPIYNEDFRAVAARLHAMDRSLAEAGVSDRFDVFILSDTTDAEIAAEERAGFTALKASTVSTFYYRRRDANTERKAGNLAEWVQRFGAAYPTMIVLDADSLMDGGLMARLVGAMDRRPDIGLIQTVPSIVNGATLFSRWAQFGVRLYGRISATGLAWWSGSEASYWGHNAVIRTRAFAAHASLPCLRGRKPFGGHLMSHDVPEATLIRRGGWGVHVAPVSGGSYEESPPSLIDAAIRDRRWCQGNLQHARIINGKGLHWVSRSHLVMGLMAYAMSPLWLTFLGVWVALTLQLGSFDEQYGSWSDLAKTRTEGQSWSFDDITLPTWSGSLAVILLVGPKLLGAILILSRKAERMRFGGGRKLLAGLTVEIMISALMAPVLALTQTRFMIEILMGRDSGWKTQQRDAAGSSWKTAFARYWWITALGCGLIAAASPWPPLLLASSPLLIGMLLVAPFAVYSSRRSIGAWAAPGGLMATPEELSPAPVLERRAIWPVAPTYPLGDAIPAAPALKPAALDEAEAVSA